MIDHLCVAPDQTTLIAAIGSFVPAGPNPQPLWLAGDAESAAGWRGDIAFEVAVFDGSTPQTITNPDGSTSTIQVPTPVPDQYALWIALPVTDPNLAASPTCVLIADRDAANAGNPAFILQTSMSQDQLNNYTISPVVAGSGYPFGNVAQ